MIGRARIGALVALGAGAALLLAAVPAATAGTPPTPERVTTLGPKPSGPTWIGWALGGDATGNQTTAIAPLPDATYDDGSLHLATADGSAKAQAGYSLVSGTAMTALSSVTSLSYSTYVDPSASNQAAPALQFSSFCGGTVGNGFTTFVFEPVYNTAQGAVTTGTWQHWDAIDGGNAIWWSTRAVGGIGAQTDYVSWNTIKADCPDAASYQLLLDLGSGASGADAYADDVEMNGTTWDFAMPGTATIAFTGAPASVVTGAAPSTFSVAVANPADGPDYQQVRPDVTLSGVTGLKASQVTFEAQESGNGTWTAAVLADEPDGTISGYFPPQSGGTLSPGFSGSTPVRVAIAAGAPSGTLTLKMMIDYIGVDPLAIATASTQIAVTAPVTATPSASPSSSAAPLAATGTDSASLGGLAAVLLASGLGLLLLGRRRTRGARAS